MAEIAARNAFLVAVLGIAVIIHIAVGGAGSADAALRSGRKMVTMRRCLTLPNKLDGNLNGES